MKRLGHLETLFPNLRHSDYFGYSQATSLYNCIAYAVGDVDHWWDHNHSWPSAAPRGEDLDDLVRAYRSQGFERCSDELRERGYEKVAIYSKAGKWTHAARLRDDGWWESKIGKLEDIVHRRADDLAGDDYGAVALFMKRKLALRVEYQIGYRSIPPSGLNIAGPP